MWTHPVSTERIETADGLVFERCPLLHRLNIPHAFGTRHGGLRGDADRLCKTLAVDPDAIRMVRQVHGNTIAQADAAPCEADGIVSSFTPVAVYTADCVQILVGDGRLVAAVHAGWRGVLKGVHTAVLAHFDRPTVSVGPCIGPDHFEVGDEVRNQFDTTFHVGRCIDLRQAIVADLIDAGVRDISVSRSCTFANAEDFCSYRRDGAGGHHMLSVIAPPTPITAG